MMLVKQLKMLKDKLAPKGEEPKQELEFEMEAEDEEEPGSLQAKHVNDSPSGIVPPPPGSQQAKRVDNKETGIVPPPAGKPKYKLKPAQRPNAVAGVRG